MNEKVERVVVIWKVRSGRDDVGDLFEILDATVGGIERVEGAPVSYNIVRKLHNMLASTSMHGDASQYLSLAIFCNCIGYDYYV